MTLENGEHAAALKDLLQAWAKHPHPRIAALIEQMGSEIDRAAEPIESKSIALRTQAWTAIAEKRNPADVGRLLAVPWPAQVKDAINLVVALGKMPADPRIATALMVQRDKLRYTSNRARYLWRIVHGELARAQDVRVVPLLRECAKRRRPPYLDDDLAGGALRTIKALEAIGTPAIPNDVRKLVETLEKRYAQSLKQAQDKASGDAKLLADIYAAPDDLPLRDVYGDWLAERRDPRGEFIAIQRAHGEGRQTPASLTRERALLTKHGEAWAGPLDAHLEKDGRVFENGFLTGGVLNAEWARQTVVPSIDPAWLTIRRLHVSSEHPLVTMLLEGLPHLRGIFGANVPLVRRLAKGRKMPIVELGITPAEPVPLDKAPGLPHLRKLELLDSSPLWPRLGKSPLGKRLEEVTLLVEEGVDPAIVERSFRDLPSLRTIAIRRQDPESPLEPRGFTMILDRDGAARGFFRAGHHRPNTPRSIVTALEGMPASLQALTIEPSRFFPFKTDERADIDKALARFTKLTTCTLPWGPAPKRVKPAKRSGPRLLLRIQGRSLLAPKLGWQAVEIIRAGFGLDFDSMSVNFNYKDRPLGDEPEKRVETWVKSPKCRHLSLSQEGAAHSLSIGRDHPLAETHLTWDMGDDTPDQVIAVVEKLVDLTQAVTARVSLQDKFFELEDFGHSDDVPHGAWLMVLGPKAVPYFTTAELAKLSIAPALRGLTVRAVKDRVFVRLGPAPTITGKPAQTALSRGLMEIYQRNADRRMGVHTLARVTEILGPVAAKLGLQRKPTQTLHAFRFAGASGKQKNRVLTFMCNDLMSKTWRVSAALRVYSDNTSWWPEDLIEDVPVRSAADLDKILRQVAELALQAAPPFFASH